MCSSNILSYFKSLKVRDWESISYLGSYMHTWCFHVFYEKSMHWPWPGRLWKISQERAESIHFLSNTTLDHRNIRYLLTSHCSPLVSKNTFSDFTLDFWNTIHTMDQWAFDCAIKRGLSQTSQEDVSFLLFSDFGFKHWDDPFTKWKKLISFEISYYFLQL